MSSADPEHREEEEAPAGEDEDTGAQVAPVVKLEEVAVSTGEENEDVLLDLKSKLYRFDKDGNQWKERGAGTVKFLKQRVTGKVRLVMRQSKTLKICANHLIIPSMTVQEHAGNEKSCVWHASDYADGELKDELFCIRFASIENCKTFMEKFQEIAESQKSQGALSSIDCKTFMEKFQEIAESQKSQEENKDATAAAGLLENLSVKEKEDEVKKDTEKKETEKEDTEKKETEKEDTEKKGDEPSSSSA